jgi:hypothetical protein
MRTILVCAMLVIGTSAISANVAAQGQGQGSGSAPVRIIEPLPLPVTDSDNPARHPFQAVLCFHSAGPTACPNDVPRALTVSSDSRLVIEFVSGSCFASAASGFPIVRTVQLRTTVANEPVPHQFLFVPVEAGATAQNVVLSQSTKIYADPSTQVVLGVAGAGATTTQCVVSISGYTITP